ncbi:MAG TPA: DegT/DnrJ/EryC1/StrS family aminotransferase [Candidatus Hydrogenedentes bacterium]|nr:DegT/DnrJ/EryC1/StrS family aminotransferase [Candidatus Hydrogenedentota bacterium]
MHSFENPIYVTRPTMPPLEEYQEMMTRLWETRWLTNNGAFHQELEARLCDYLDVEHLSLFCNATIALIVALQNFRITTGEVITTPFTFAATPHVLYWNGIQPVFCDIDPKTFNMDPARIEQLITPQTRAILPVHVYGTPCDIDAIQGIANRHGLTVIYDAAHTFGVRYHGKSLCSYGDASVLSFHATKLFSTGEGGALVTPSRACRERVDFLKNFGYADEETVIGPGINGKMNEFQAAFGLLQLKRIQAEIDHRREIDRIYRENLAGIPGITIPVEALHTQRNFAYFPILVDQTKYGISRDELHTRLRDKNVYARKYFHPLCSHYPCYAALPSANPQNLPVAERIAQQILCLPIYGTLDLSTVERISQFLGFFQKSSL